MIEFGILELSCLLNKSAGLNEKENAEHEGISNQTRLIYTAFGSNASRNSSTCFEIPHSPHPLEAQQACFWIKGRFNVAFHRAKRTEQRLFRLEMSLDAKFQLSTACPFIGHFGDNFPKGAMKTF
jgi:hypothetical protein